MAKPDDRELLEGLRCANGCDVQFLTYLEWEGTTTRIADCFHDTSNGQDVWYYNIGIRCQDCFVSVGFKGVPVMVKEALDRMILKHQNVVRDAVDEVDTDHLKGADYLKRWEDLVEGNRGLE